MRFIVMGKRQELWMSIGFFAGKRRRGERLGGFLGSRKIHDD
jgi:hypothetical protein